MSRSVGVPGAGGGGGGGGNVVVVDGVDSGIKATVLDLTSSNPQTVITVDSNGDYIAPGGGGTQYDQGTATTDTDKLTMAGLVRRDTAALATGVADGDRLAGSTDALGRIRVTSIDVTQPVSAASLPLPTGASTEATLAAAAASLAVMDDWDETDRAKVNLIAGQVAILGGTGVDAANVPRVSLATNVALPAGTNNIGDVDVLTLPSIPAGSNNIGDVDVLTLPAITGTVTANIGTSGSLALEATLGSVKTAVEIMDDWDETDRAKVNLIAAQVGILGGSGVDAANVPRVTLATNVALPAGTNAIGKLAANSGVDIGDVDVTSLPAIPAGNNNIGDVDVASIAAGSNIIGNVRIDQTTPGTTNGVVASIAAAQTLATVTTVSTVTAVTTLTGSGVAHDAADSGNPHKVGGKAKSPDGTDPGSVAEDDRTDAKYDLNGRAFVNAHHPRSVYKHLDGSTAYTDESLFADPGDGFQIIITSIIVATNAATAMNFFLEEGATKIFGPIGLEAVAGRGFVSGPIYLPVTASTAVTITTSASIAQSVHVNGYIQAV